jgi:cytochrome c-type biogenesis protein CcmH
VRTRASLILLAALALAAGGVAFAATEEPPPPDARSVVGPPHGPTLSGAALDARAEEVAALLRCPVCQGLSVKDSPSGMAQKMKAEVREMVAAGYDEDQVLGYFEHSYGEFVRLEPPLRGVNYVVWLAPVAGLLLGGAVVFWTLRRPKAGSAEAPASVPAPGDPPGAETLPEDPRLAACVLRVRELAYGWPGGVPPRKDPS